MQQMSNFIQNQLKDRDSAVNMVLPKRKRINKQKSAKKGKNVKQKKMEKDPQVINSLINLDADNNIVKQKSDEDNSVTTYQSYYSTINLATTFIAQPDTLLSRIIRRPTYIHVNKSNKISGNYGHSTIIFKRPILQGNYYLEILIREDGKKQKQVKYPSSVRVGICPHQYNQYVPLGCGQSIAYKSIDGNVVRNGQIVQRGQSYATNDVIGILMKISPPHKVSNPSQINEGSSVCFYKNGKLILEIKDLKQIFYCFALSLYNFSQVQVIQGVNKYEMDSYAKHYFCALNEKILYKDLAESKIFKV